MFSIEFSKYIIFDLLNPLRNFLFQKIWKLLKDKKYETVIKKWIDNSYVLKNILNNQQNSKIIQYF